MARDLALVLLVIAGIFIVLGQLFPEASVEGASGEDMGGHTESRHGKYD